MIEEMIDYKGKEYRIGLCCSLEKIECSHCCDYVELPFVGLNRISADSFEELLKTNIHVPIMNRSLEKKKLTEEGSLYLERTIDGFEQGLIRARSLGCRMVVLGSGRARDDISREATRVGGSFDGILRRLDEIVGRYSMLLLLEPLSRSSTSVVNTIADAARLIQSNDCVNTLIAADMYHMRLEGDSVDSLRKYASLIGHLHFCDSNRGLPDCTVGAFGDFLDELKESPVASISFEANEYTPKTCRDSYEKFVG